MARKKLRVGILFGGRSGEHDISLRSARSILQAIDKKKYDVVELGITKEGRWLTGSAAQNLLANGKQASAKAGGEAGITLAAAAAAPMSPTCISALIWALQRRRRSRPHLYWRISKGSRPPSSAF